MDNVDHYETSPSNQLKNSEFKNGVFPSPAKHKKETQDLKYISEEIASFSQSSSEEP